MIYISGYPHKAGTLKGEEEVVLTFVFSAEEHTKTAEPDLHRNIDVIAALSAVVEIARLELAASSPPD